MDGKEVVETPEVSGGENVEDVDVSAAGVVQTMVVFVSE